MSLLDSTVYNLNTNQGQEDSIQDIIAEQNKQYEKSQSLTTYKIVDYVQLSLVLVNGNSTGIYTTTHNHGLGYAPVVIGFVFDPNQPAPTAYDEIQFQPGGLTNTYQSFRVDSQNLYMDVYARNVGGFFSTTNFTGSFYIFNVPL